MVKPLSLFIHVRFQRHITSSVGAVLRRCETREHAVTIALDRLILTGALEIAPVRPVQAMTRRERHGVTRGGDCALGGRISLGAQCGHSVRSALLEDSHWIAVMSVHSIMGKTPRVTPMAR